ncbi:alpha/beta hydrolase [Solicola sp. PLA-1-18]|uniref:alpha/beta hydrolase n=1 Tax=Solicola sp. PLA-1-18 TaxID=3380532 RepID=UPI003B7EFE21
MPLDPSQSAALPMRWRTRALAALLKRGPGIEDLDPNELPAARTARATVRASWAGQRVYGRLDPACAVADRRVDLDGTVVRLRIYRPKAKVSRSLPLVVLFHGGGWVQGDPEQDEWLASRVATRTQAVVVSVAYRLAPEHPFPAGVDDCWAATRWVHEHADELGGDADRMAVMGDSAGGNLAAVVAMLARDAGGPRLRAQVLIYPGTEMIDVFDSEVEHAVAPVLTSRGMRTFTALYLAGQDGTVPTASPIRAESHAGLAPALVQTAGHDPLKDNGRLYADKLLAAGVPVTYTCYRDAIHGFASLPGAVPAAEPALAEIVRTLRDAFSAAQA